MYVCMTVSRIAQKITQLTFVKFGGKWRMGHGRTRQILMVIRINQSINQSIIYSFIKTNKWLIDWLIDWLITLRMGMVWWGLVWFGLQCEWRQNNLCGLKCGCHNVLLPSPWCTWWLEHGAIQIYLLTYLQPHRAFSLEVTVHVCDASHRIPSVCQVSSS